MSNLHSKQEENLSQTQKIFSRFDTRRLRDGNEIDDAIREIAWENGFKIPLAPI